MSNDSNLCYAHTHINKITTNRKHRIGEPTNL